MKIISEAVPEEGSMVRISRTTYGDPKEHGGRCDGTGRLAKVRRVAKITNQGITIHLVYTEGVEAVFPWEAVSQAKLQEIYGDKKAGVQEEAKAQAHFGSQTQAQPVW